MVSYFVSTELSGTGVLKELGSSQDLTSKATPDFVLLVGVEGGRFGNEGLGGVICAKFAVSNGSFLKRNSLSCCPCGPKPVDPDDSKSLKSAKINHQAQLRNGVLSLKYVHFIKMLTLI